MWVIIEIASVRNDKMHLINLKETEPQLAKLIEMVNTGEEVVIINYEGAAFKIIPTTVVKAIPKFGSANGASKSSEILMLH